MKYIKFELPDDFEKGHCWKCPLCHFDEDTTILHCGLYHFADECPLKIIEENE